MSKRDWKPGDVAVVEGSVMLRTGRGWLFAALNGGSWSHAEGASADRVTSLARPLVVIDPEDREQVERLSDLRKRIDHSGENLMHWEDMQAALREFADPTPPKPDEPQGLGAVVVDESEVEYIHLGAGLWVYGTTDGPSCGYEWPHVHAVRVLSEGVTP